MTRTTPKVLYETLTWHNETEVHSVRVGTADWYKWLEQSTTFAFVDSNGSFTARKERRQRGGAYWKAYRKRMGKLRRIYIGKSSELTLARLQAVAAVLAEDNLSKSGKHGQDKQQGQVGSRPTELVSTPQSTQMSQTKRTPVLPVPLTMLLGREQELAQVVELLRQRQVRIVTLVGPGGVGKTRLVLEVARLMKDVFLDGVFFIELADLRDATLVMPIIAQALGLRPSEGLSIIDQVQDYIHDKQPLLVLDNMEHLLEAVFQLEQLLTACPGVKLLITSRAVLHIQGEYEFPTLPLPLPDLAAYVSIETLSQYASIALFVQRAQAALPTFRITEENARSIAAICIHLDGLPLALELAAARVKLFPPQALLARLSQRLSMLVGNRPSIPERHQTLRATLQWSYNLLSSDEQWLFRQLCVFIGGATLAALEATCGNRGSETIDVVSIIGSLLDHSLILQTNQGTGEPRLRMLETIREYGWERLIEKQEVQERQGRHARYYLALVEEAAQHLRAGEQQMLWLARLTAEQENLRATHAFFIEQNDADQALRLGGALRWYWVTRGAFSEGSDFLKAALALPHQTVESRVRANALSVAGELALRQGNYTKAYSLLEESVTSYSKLDDTPGLGQALLNFGLLHSYQQDFIVARSLIEESIVIAKKLEDKWLLGHALDSLARLHWKQGDLEATRRLCLEGLKYHSVTGEMRALISPRKLLAAIALIEGDYTDAESLAKELLTLAGTIDDQETRFHALFTLGDIVKSQDDDIEALYYYQQCLTIAQTINSRRNKSMVLSRLGDLAFRRGDRKEAVAYYNESLSLARTFEDTAVVGWSLLGLARIAKAERQYRRAASLLGAGEKGFNPSVDLDFIERTHYERDIAALQTYLGRETYTKAWDEGRKMTPEQVSGAPESSFGTQPTTLPLYPDGLTPREVEILRLVAQGWTDTHVAEKLIISPRTVQGHLRSIYNKIAVTSRSAATRYAFEHNLA